MSSETSSKPGKFYIQTTIRDYFDTAEERDHYIKEHMEVPFEDKATLVGGGTVDHYDADEEVQMVIEVKEVQE